MGAGIAIGTGEGIDAMGSGLAVRADRADWFANILSCNFESFFSGGAAAVGIGVAASLLAAALAANLLIGGAGTGGRAGFSRDKSESRLGSPSEFDFVNDRSFLSS